MCADFQDPVEMIPQFVSEWEKGYKIVIGRKTESKENPFVYFLRGCYYKLIKKMSSCEQIEQFTGFGLYDSSFVQTMQGFEGSYSVYSEELWRSLALNEKKLNIHSRNVVPAKRIITGIVFMTLLC